MIRLLISIFLLTFFYVGMYGQGAATGERAEQRRLTETDLTQTAMDHPRYPSVYDGVVYSEISRTEYNALRRANNNDCFRRGEKYYSYRIINSNFSPTSTVLIGGYHIQILHASQEIIDMIREWLSPLFPWHLQSFSEQGMIISIANYTGSDSFDRRLLMAGSTNWSQRKIEITLSKFYKEEGRINAAKFTLLHEFGHAMQIARPRLIPRCVHTSSDCPSYSGRSSVQPCSTERDQSMWQREQNNIGARCPGYPAKIYATTVSGTLTQREQTAYAYMYYWIRPSELLDEDRQIFNDFFREQCESRGIPFTPR